MQILFRINNEALNDEVVELLSGNEEIRKLGLKILCNLIQKGAIEVEFPKDEQGRKS